jgi:glutathione synthase/RimK-type ligase-like ATP-grasp enzyme
MVDVETKPANLPSEIERLLFDLVGQYKLRFAAIDLARTTAGEWVFFEVNPNGQWAWLDIAAEFDIGSSFIRSFS